MVELPEALTEALNRQARSQGLTLNTILQGAWAILLGRLTGRDDVVFGATVAGRPSEIAGIQTMVGLFINTLPVRVRLRPTEPLSELLTRLQDSQSQLIAHQHLSLAEIQRLMGLGQLFDTLVVFENYPVDRSVLEEPAAGLRLTSVEAHDATHYPLSLLAAPGERLRLRFQYRPDLFESHRVEAIGRRLMRLLEAASADPNQRIGHIDILEPEERQQILVDWNNTDCEVPHTTLPALFEAQVRRSPEATALIFEESTLSYAQLNAQANRLAHLLIGRGIGPENLVALALPRSAEMVIGLLGILKAGAAYLPFDPDYPAERLAYILRDAQPVCLLTTAQIAQRLPETIVHLLLDHAETISALTQHPETNPSDRERTQPFISQNPAYVIYTSGSTGTPKGVVVTHGNATGFLAWASAEISSQRLSRVLAATSLNFDVSVFEIFAPLLLGGSIEIVRDLLAIAEYPQIGSRVSLISGVPSVFSRLINDGTLCGNVNTVVLAGEALSARALRDIHSALPGCEIANFYGPTEATVYATAWYSNGETNETPPIGRPIWNTRVYVLDRSLQPVPVGIAGELYLAGEGSGAGLPEPSGLKRRALRGRSLRSAGKTHVSDRRPGPVARRGGA